MTVLFLYREIVLPHIVLPKWLKNLPKEKDKVEYGRMFHYETYNQALTEEDMIDLLRYLGEVK